MYYLSVDKLLEAEAVKVIDTSENTVAFFPSHFPQRQHPRVKYFQLLDDPLAQPWPRFSGDGFSGFYHGFTVTYIAIQLAVFMGFKEIYLVGVDHNYSLAAQTPAVAEIHGLKVFQTTTEKNYFLPDYHQPGDTFFQHKPDENEMAYRAAETSSKGGHFRIFNATRGGNLEVFERRDFDALFD